MNKVYKSLNYLNYTTTIVVGSVHVTINFNGGFMRPYRQNGKFATDDKRLQLAIEKDLGYGRDFVLTDKFLSVENASPEEEIIVGEEVNNVQKAKDYLVEKFPDKVKISDLKNKNIVLDKAKELKVVFTAL
jgi:hypothetical protein